MAAQHSVHPIVVKLFADVMARRYPELAALGPTSPIQALPHHEAMELLQLAIQMTGQDDIGVLAAEAAEPGHFELVEIASRTQRTLGEGVETLVALAPMLHEGMCFELTKGPERSSLTLSFAAGLPVPAAGYDFIVASLVIAGRRQTAQPELGPSRVALPYARPVGPPALARLLRCPLEFDAPRLQLDFPTARLPTPLVRADASMGSVLREVGHDLLERAAAQKRSQLEVELRARIRAALPTDTLSAQSLARALSMSERTLRRKLETDGLSLRTLIDEVRREVALELLAADRASTDEIAGQLGFTTTQAFHRAFRRWTGVTVAAHRARLRAS